MPRQDRHSIRGYLEVDTLEEMVADERIETVIVVFPDMYGRLVGKRVTGSFFINDVVDHGLRACDSLLASDIEIDPVPGDKLAGSVKGFGDLRLVPDMQTLRIASWLPQTAIVLCDVCEESEKERLIDIAPRNMLRKQSRRASDLGYFAMGASELELYVFKDSFEDVTRKGFVNLEPFGNHVEDYHILQGTEEEDIVGAIRHHLDHSAIPVESSKDEWGPGQQEIGLRYTDLLEMADRHVLYKHAAKEIAWQRGHAITFMAKWNEKWAGSSCHIHASLWDRAGRLATFDGEEALGPVKGSPVFRWFLGGWMAHIRELFAFYAPYPASYKRYVPGSYAPTGIAWSYGNRTAGFRILGRGPSLRIECRLSGSDTNPYLAFAATLAAGLDGIEKRIEPPPMFDGDVSAAGKPAQVPHSLIESIGELENSTFAREAFGTDVIDHYLQFFRTEQRKFDEVVTDWERRRYFERA